MTLPDRHHTGSDAGTSADLEAERELLTRRLVDEYTHAEPSYVAQVVQSAFETLQAAGARVPNYLPLFAERLTRQRLTEPHRVGRRSPDHQPGAPKLSTRDAEVAGSSPS